MKKAEIYSKARLTESYWPREDSRTLSNLTVGQGLRDAAAEAPDRLALVEGIADPARRRWTYAELLAYTERVASALLDRFNPGERVAVWAPNVVEWELIELGCAIAGITLVTISPAFQLKELEHILTTAEVSGLFLVDEYRGHNTLATARQVQKGLPKIREIIRIGEFDEFVENGSNNKKFPVVDPKEPFLIMFTSGTTGYPKGAMLHHMGLMNSMDFMTERAGLENGGVWVNVMPMFHMGGAGFPALGSIQRRATHVMLPGFDAELYLKMVESEKGTFSLLVPTMLEMLLSFPERKKYDLSSLKNILSGASKVEADLVRRVKSELGCSMSIVFGQTEANGGITQTHLDDTPEDQANTIGQPYPQCEVKIADHDSGAVLPLGVDGEICCRGYQTMLGYYNLPEESAKTLRPDGWLHTGDIGRMDERGFLQITGRLKDMIIRGGENIYPAEIEMHLTQHPKVLKASVVGIPDQHWGEQIAAIIILKSEDDRPSIEELNSYCKKNLASYKRPRFWYFVKEFPSTDAGKIRKFMMLDMILNGELKETTE